MKKINLVIVVMFFSSILFAQSSTCKVVNKELKGIYKGDCKDGLAHGKGVFTFENGMFIYKGEFENGKMEGKGEIYSIINKEKKLITKGSWSDNVYVGAKNLKPYDVIITENLDRNLVRKNGDGNRVFFNFLQNGNRNNVRNLSVIMSSGNTLAGSNVLGYENMIFPVKCQITYVTASKLKASSYTVRYELLINEPGEWEVTLYN